MATSKSLKKTTAKSDKNTKYSKTPSSTKKTKSSSKKTTIKKNNSQKVNNSKHHNVIKISDSKVRVNSKEYEIQSYSCIRKYYIIKDNKTKEEKHKRMWIVIGDGHKWYRKFETQADAINYFRNLKKYAKMRVQSVKLKDFIKTVYTFMLMQAHGVDVDEIIKLNKNKKIINNDDKDFEDEFSEFDVVDNDYNDFDHEKVNKIIAEKEKDVVVVDSTQELSESINDDIEDEIKFIDQNVEPNAYYDLNNDEKFEKSFVIFPENQESVEKDENDLYSLSQESAIDETKVIDLNNSEEEITFKEIKTTSDDVIQVDNEKLNNDFEEKSNVDSKPSKAQSVIYWTVIALICAILATIVVIAILFGATK